MVIAKMKRNRSKKGKNSILEVAKIDGRPSVTKAQVRAIKTILIKGTSLNLSHPDWLL